MKLLLAEDEKDLSKALVVVLTHNNYSVDAVYDGQSALDYLLSEDYDAAILDIMMPELDGLSVLKVVRDRKINVPVILLTAKSEVDDRVLGLDVGADDYLAKPFATKELLARIRAIVRRKDRVFQNELKYGNISLNPATFELSTKNGSLHLAAKEYQMMEILISNPKILISTEKFLEKIWGYDTQAEINVVWVNISNLRKKLSSLEANVEIKASRGTGYTLEMKV